MQSAPFIDLSRWSSPVLFLPLNISSCLYAGLPILISLVQYSGSLLTPSQHLQVKSSHTPHILTQSMWKLSAPVSRRKRRRKGIHNRSHSSACMMSLTWELMWKPQRVSSSGISLYSRSLNFLWHIQQFMTLQAHSYDEYVPHHMIYCLTYMIIIAL